MEIITGYTGKPHVTSEQDRDVNIGVVGEKSYVLQTGMQLAAEVSSNNEIKIRDGVLMHQGCTASIKKNTYDSLTIINGSQGMKRIDLIVARYEKNQDNGIESLDLKVIQGTPAESTPTVPEYTEGDIQAGDYVADMPMYQVIINGLNITEVKKVCEVAPDIDALKKEIAELNSKIEITENGMCIKYANGIMKQCIKSSVLTGNFSAWGSCYYASVPAIPYIEPFKTVADAHVRIEADGQAWSMDVDNGTLEKSPAIYAIRPSSPGGQIRVTARVCAVGTWK
jgi:hypothetical protein